MTPQTVLSDLKKGHAIWCCSNMLSTDNPWWMVTALEVEAFERMYQIDPDLVHSIITNGLVNEVDTKPPVSSWSRGYTAQVWGGWVVSEKGKKASSLNVTGEKQ